MVNNQEIAVLVDEIMGTLIQAVPEAYNTLENGNRELFRTIAADMEAAFFSIINVAEKEKEEEFKKLTVCCKNCYASLSALKNYEKEDEVEIALNKLEFELFSLLRIGYVQFKYFALIEGDKEKEKLFWEYEAQQLCKNYYIEESKKSGVYKYDVTIMVLAYNNLEYTKACVEAVLRNMPRKLRCELILVNHGSNDGTKEYFESVFPDKQIDVKINSNGWFVHYFITEGKYLLVISNDVVIGKNTVEIMYECMEEDENIAYAVPVTPNISNLQTDIKPGGISYHSMMEFQKVVAKYNKRDRQLEEYRFRLLNPISMYRTEYIINSKQTMAVETMLLKMKNLHFSDDAISLYFRRAGYKNVLLKDVYCHHFGSVTVGKSYDYLEGRKLFFNSYNIDPWERGFCYSYNLFHHLKCDKADASGVLGINAGLGSDPLKIKEEIKRYTGNFDVKVTNYTMDLRYIEDLFGVSDEVKYVRDWNALHQQLKEEYDYIMVCGGLENQIGYKEELAFLYGYLKENGVLIFQTPLKRQAEAVMDFYATTGTIIEAVEHPCRQDVEIIQYCVCITK